MVLLTTNENTNLAIVVDVLNVRFFKYLEKLVRDNFTGYLNKRFDFRIFLLNSKCLIYKILFIETIKFQFKRSRLFP